MIGDLLIAESIKWPLTTMKLKYGLDQPPTNSDDIVFYYKPKPEIKVRHSWPDIFALGIC